MNALYWENRLPNPHLVVRRWYMDPLLDGSGNVHPDLVAVYPMQGLATASLAPTTLREREDESRSGESSQKNISPSWEGAEGGLDGGPNRGAPPYFLVGLRRAGATQQFATFFPKSTLAGDATLSLRGRGGWESLGTLKTGLPFFWNVGRRQGQQTLRATQGSRMALRDFFVGTPVKKGQATQVTASYGRVVLDVLADTFDQDMLLSVMPVRLDEIQISNVPDISDLDFMPIVEILPETPSSEFRKPVTLTYQYTQDEVKAIGAGTYPGLSRGVNLDNVQIYHVSESGHLLPAKTMPGTDRWIDRDGDGVLGSPGDVYRITAQLSHFSIYAALEGLIPDQPRFMTDEIYTPEPRVSIVGYLQKGFEDKPSEVLVEGENVFPQKRMPSNGAGAGGDLLGFVMYLDDDAQFVQSDDKTPPVVLPIKENQIEWLMDSPSYNVRFRNIEIPEGNHYLTLTYPTDNLKILNRPYATMHVVRDNTPPALRVYTLNGEALSTHNAKVWFSPLSGLRDSPIVSEGSGESETSHKNWIENSVALSKRNLFSVGIFPTEKVTVMWQMIDHNGLPVFAKTLPNITELGTTLTWSGARNPDMPTINIVASDLVPEGLYQSILTFVDQAGHVSQVAVALSR